MALQSLLLFLSLLLSLILHEWAHAKVATLWGDPTPAVQNRLSINPLRHLDPVGTIFLALIALSGWGVGWAKPVQISPSRFKRPRCALFFVSLAGPAMNLFLAFAGWFLFALFVKFEIFALQDQGVGGLVFNFAYSFLLVNVSLFFFNLLPLAPLDGSNVLLSLLPKRLSAHLEVFFAKWGLLPLLLLLVAEWATPFKSLTKLILPAIREVVSGVRVLVQL